MRPMVVPFVLIVAAVVVSLMLIVVMANQLYVYADGQATLIGSESQQDVVDAVDALMKIVEALPTGERFGEEERQVVLNELSAVSGDFVFMEDIPVTMASSVLAEDDFADAFPDSVDDNQTLTISTWIILGGVLCGLGFFFFRKRSD